MFSNPESVSYFVKIFGSPYPSMNARVRIPYVDLIILCETKRFTTEKPYLSFF